MARQARRVRRAAGAVARKQLEEGTKQAAHHHHRFPWCTGSVENRETARSVVSGTIRMSVLPVILPAVQLGGKFRAFLVHPSMEIPRRV